MRPFDYRAPGPSQPIFLAAAIATLAAAFGLVILATTPSDDSWATAVATGDQRMAQRLVAAGADPDAPRHMGLTPLMRAVARDDVDLAAILLAAGADLEATGPENLRPIHVAAVSGANETATLLLESGADPARRSISGMNALDHAAANGSVEVIETLVEFGLDPNGGSGVVTQGHGYPRDRGSPPLSIAVRAGELEAARALLELGADVNARSDSGLTALLVAVFTGQPRPIVEELVAAGADLSIVVGCDDGCSQPPGNAFDWAVRLGRDELVSTVAP